MHTLEATDLLNANGTTHCCPLCKGKRVILTEQLVKPRTTREGFMLSRAAGRNVESTFLHALTCDARIKAFR